jgi:wyosine [tRNA(Phe)-imidazoG37] synthetase (radical SAM superfamily)
MQTVLFTETIFGPIHSRRLGSSLGVNLMPRDGKVCSFDCLYCEAGFNAQGPGTTGLPSRAEVAQQLEAKLQQLRADSAPLDVITFSGNGEPTLHPEFAGVIDDTLELRNRYFPQVKVSVLTNSTRIDRPEVVDALRRVDNNILKLDSAIESTMQALDRPNAPGFTAAGVIDRLCAFSGTGIVQTMMLRGDGIDNTTDAEVAALIDAYRRIAPREIMLYTIDRKTPDELLRKVPADELQAIAARITAATAIPVQVSA